MSIWISIIHIICWFFERLDYYKAFAYVVMTTPRCYVYSILPDGNIHLLDTLNICSTCSLRECMKPFACKSYPYPAGQVACVIN